MVDPIALAIPLFFVAMATEIAVSARRGRLAGPRPDWRAVDAVADLACGISSQVVGLGTAVAITALYTLVAGFAPHPLPADSALVWIASFVAVDLLYYAWHRASHRVNVLWAAHAVHHQSEDYNFAVALRQSMLTPITAIPFYAPLAIFGVPPVVFLTCSALNTLYQFWIHTRLVGKLGVVDLVLNTPSHHRVHHGVNPAYIDKNHAGVFIVWDRLFGTYAEEREEPIFGVVEGFASASPWRANFEPFRKLAALSARCRGVDRLRVWFAPPEWRPAYLGGPLAIPEPSPVHRWAPPATRGQLLYMGAWFVLASAALCWVLVRVPEWPVWRTGLVGGLVLWTVTAWGALLDGRRGARALELARLGALPLAGATFGGAGAVVGATAAILSAVALLPTYSSSEGRRNTSNVRYAAGETVPPPT